MSRYLTAFAILIFANTPTSFAVVMLCDPGTQGDLDGNGTVEFADFLTLDANYLTAAADHTSGDINCSGSVGFQDFVVLSSNFGKTVGGGGGGGGNPVPGVTPIPELNGTEIGIGVLPNGKIFLRNLANFDVPLLAVEFRSAGSRLATGPISAAAPFQFLLSASGPDNVTAGWLGFDNQAVIPANGIVVTEFATFIGDPDDAFTDLTFVYSGGSSSTIPQGGVITAVPEPGAFLYLGLVGLGFVAWRRACCKTTE